MTFNTTCDIYQAPHVPPAAPDVAGVACFLRSDFTAAHATPSLAGPILRWTHVMEVPIDVDVRDHYTGPTTANQFAGYEEGYDLTVGSYVYVPDKNGTLFYTVFVERVGYGTASDRKRVYLQRTLPAWPTNYL